MQYTGLKDKNGKEIYEGDWVKDAFSSVGLVEWQEKDMRFMFRNNIGKGWLNPSIGCMDGPTLEVIGNIYGNVDDVIEINETRILNPDEVKEK